MKNLTKSRVVNIPVNEEGTQSQGSEFYMCMTESKAQTLSVMDYF